MSFETEMRALRESYRTSQLVEGHSYTAASFESVMSDMRAHYKGEPRVSLTIPEGWSDFPVLVS